MKKGILCFLAALLLCVCTLQQADGAEQTAYVVDSADLLTQQEEQKLSDLLSGLSDEHSADLVVLTVPTLGTDSPKRYADGYYDENGYTDDGILLLVSIQDRQWYISTCGRCIDIVDYWGTDYLADSFLASLSGGDYYDAVAAFGSNCDRILSLEAEGYYDGKTAPSGISGTKVLVCLGIGIVAALILTGIMRAQLKSVRSQRSAASYVLPGSLQITHSRDLYLYRNVTRRAKPKSSSHSSGGRSHGGGGGRF